MPQCSRCKLKGLECVYDNMDQKQTDLQLRGLDEEKSGTETIGLVESITDQWPIPSHIWQMSNEESRETPANGDIPSSTHNSLVPALYNPLANTVQEPSYTVDFQLNGSLPLDDSSIDLPLSYNIDVPWPPQTQTKGNQFSDDRLGQHITRDIYLSSQQLAIEPYAYLEPSQLIDQQGSRIGYDSQDPTCRH